MSPFTAEEPHLDILSNRDNIARQWYLSLLSLGSIPLDCSEALQKFSLLTGRVIDFLLTEEPQADAAVKIGADLAGLPCVEQSSIDISGRLWSSQPIERLFPVEPALLRARLLLLIGGMATGFMRRVLEMVLGDQEEIRSAMATNLKRTSDELKKYQDRLETMLAERTRELRESEEQFRTIADTSIEGIYQAEADSTSKLIYVNAAFAKMLGYTKEELLGRNTATLLAETEVPKLPPLVDAIRENNFGEGESRLVHKDGHLVDIHFTVVSTQLKGRIIRSGIVQDITEQKKIQKTLFESEERYRNLAEASPDMITIIGPDDRLLYNNSFAATLLGTPADKLIGRLRTDFFPSPENDYQEQHFRQVLKDGKKIYSEALATVHDRSIWLGTWLVPLRDTAGNIIAVMAVSRDISIQKQAELEILRSRDELEERVKLRTAELSASQAQLRQLTDQLVTSIEDERHRISRELHDEAGQALISLKYGLASLQNDLPERNRAMRERLAASMDTIDQVISDIRTLSHSLRPPVLEIIGINLSLRDYCNEFSKRTGLRVSYRGREIPGLPDQIGLSLYRFVQEALTNVLKHAQATEAAVSLRKTRQQIILSVSDNGRGMDDTQRSDGIGLIGIQERLKFIGGTLQILPGKTRGITITTYVPWPKPANDPQNPAT